MRLYTVTGILFIVAIVDFALAAPVLAQEKRQASAEIANIPEQVTVFGKRGDNVGRIKYIVDYFAAPKVEAAASKSANQGKDSDYVMVQKPPSSVSKPGEDSSKTTKSRRSSGTARDGLDAA